MTKDINKVDVAFIIDTTGSMGSLISSAKSNMVSMIKKLSANAAIDMRFGIVEFRDHPPEDHTYAAKCHGFTDDLKQAQAIINKLTPSGGGDNSESVLDGLSSAAKDLKWHQHSRRIAILIGDAPPHGSGDYGDHFPKGCPCGKTVHSTTGELEENRISLYAIGLTPIVNKSFTELAAYTGGEYFQSDASQAVNSIAKILQKEFSDIEFDTKVLELWESSHSVEDIVKTLESSTVSVNMSLARLGSRGLLGK